MKYPYIFFDLDGTLTDPKLGITTCCQYGLRSIGIDVPDLKDLECFIGPPLIESWMETYGITEDKAREALGKFRERFQTVGIFENELLDGVPQMLSTLKAQGKILTTSSSKPELFVKQILEHFEIAQYFDVICGSSMDEKHAGKAEIIADTLNRLNLTDADAEKILMTGDRCYDIEGARAHGIRGVGVTFGYGSLQELTEAGAWKIADNMEELTAILSE